MTMLKEKLGLDDISELLDKHGKWVDELAEANDNLGTFRAWAQATTWQRGGWVPTLQLIFERGIIETDFDKNLLAIRMLHSVGDWQFARLMAGVPLSENLQTIINYFSEEPTLAYIEQYVDDCDLIALSEILDGTWSEGKRLEWAEAARASLLAEIGELIRVIGNKRCSDVMAHRKKEGENT